MTDKDIIKQLFSVKTKKDLAHVDRLLKKEYPSNQLPLNVAQAMEAHDLLRQRIEGNNNG